MGALAGPGSSHPQPVREAERSSLKKTNVTSPSVKNQWNVANYRFRKFCGFIILTNVGFV